MDKRVTNYVDIKSAANNYWNLGWSTFPVKASTSDPLVKWTPYQEKRATAADIAGWFWTNDKLNIGLATGKASGVIVLDLDEKNDVSGSKSLTGRGLYSKIPKTVTCKTPNGGRHYYFKHPGFKVANSIGIFPGVDIKADGGKVELPPSTKPRETGGIGIYEWEHSPDTTPIADMPDWLIELCKSKQERAPFLRDQSFVDTTKIETTDYGRKALEKECEALAKVTAGSRNDALNKAACKMGNLIEGEHLNENEARDALFDACISQRLG